MKKLGLAVFIGAIVIGSILSNISVFKDAGVSNLFSSTNGSGVRKTEQRDINGFDKIEASGAVNLKVSAQKDFGLNVEADDNVLQFVKTEVENDTLKIFVEGNIKRRNSINVAISMPQISALDIANASTATLENIAGDQLKLSASGASKIEADGEIKVLQIDASGASSIKTINTKAEQVSAEASGASKATVFAIDELKARASGASRITYTGTPSNIEKSVSGASSVSQE